MKYVCIGAGATGAITGAFPAIAGQEVWFVDPYAEHMKAISEKGLEIRQSTFEDPSNETVFNVKLKAQTDTAGIGQADVILLMTKSCDTISAIDSMKSVYGSNSIIITLQNGLGNIELLGEYFSSDRIVYGYTTISSLVVAPGIITPRMPSYHQIVLGCENKALKPELDAVIADYRAGGCDIEYDDNIATAIWEKAAMNCGANGISALLRMTARNCFAFQDYMDLYNAIIEEVDAVASAKGLSLNKDTIYRNGFAAQPAECSSIPDTPCSMVQDVLCRRQTEIEFLNGAVVREGIRLNVPTPLNNMVYRLIKILQASYDKRL